MYLRDVAGAEAVRISYAGIRGLCKYSIQAGEKERMHVAYNLAPSGSSLRLGGTDWGLRGDLLARSFNMVDGRNDMRMTHAPCWTAHGGGYKVHMKWQQDAPLSLCLAIIMDNAALYGPRRAVPTD